MLKTIFLEIKIIFKNIKNIFKNVIRPTAKKIDKYYHHIDTYIDKLQLDDDNDEIIEVKHKNKNKIKKE